MRHSRASNELAYDVRTQRNTNISATVAKIYLSITAQG
jgi:hypothetical protein